MKIISFLLLNMILFCGLRCSCLASMAETGAKGLLLNSTARESAMADACVALNDSINALNYNPSGIAQLRSFELSFQHTGWLVGTKYGYFAFLYPLGYGAFGLSFTHIDYGTFQKRNMVGFEEGEFEAYDYTADIAYGTQISKHLDAGIRIRYHRQKIDIYNSKSYPVDAGVIYKIAGKKVNIGLAVQNLGRRAGKMNSRRERLPEKIRAGAALKPFGEAVSLHFEHDIVYGGYCFTNFGVELSPSKLLSLRSGFSSSPEYKEQINLKAGIGINFSACYFDYSYEPFSDLGSAQKFSLRLKF